MARFKYTNTSQGLMLTVNLKEQLLPNTFEWTLDYLIDKIDTSIFDQNYHNDDKGAAAYSPKVLLKLIIYCYSVGILSSRQMERACKNNITLKSLAEDSEPDHATIAAFISGNAEAIKDIFTQVLLQCSKLKLITGEMFAADGCKLPSNASKEWSGTIEDLKKKRDKLEKYVKRILLIHQDLDKSEDAKKKQEPYRKTMGDDQERRSRSIQRLEKKLKKLNEFLEKAKPKIGVSGEEVQTNITDPESAKIKGPHGYIQGYNGITMVDSGNQIIVCAEVVGSGSESGSFPALLDNLEETMKEMTGKKEPLKDSLVEADTGFFSEANLQEAEKRKVAVLIPDPQFRKRDPTFEEQKGHDKEKKRFTQEDFNYDKKRDSFICPAGKELEYKADITLRNNQGKQYKGKRESCGNCPLMDKCINKRTGKHPVRTLYIIERNGKDNLSEKMKEKIDDPANRELYSRRMQIVEAPFSDITYCKGMNRFTLRGERKVDIQWKLYCIVHNIGKCIKALGKKYGA